MAKIISIKPQRAKFFDVTVQNDAQISSYRLHIDTVVAHKLRASTSLTPAAIRKILDDDTTHRLFDTALTMLQRHPSSAAHLSEKLIRKGVSKPLVERVINHLKETKHLDEASLAVAVTDYFLDVEDKGPLALKALLTRKGFPQALIEDALKRFSHTLEAQKCARAAEQALKTMKRTTAAAQKRTLASRLSQRGFTPSVIHKTIHALTFDETEGTRLHDAFARARTRYDIDTHHERRKLIAKLMRDGFEYADIVALLEDKT